MKKSADLDIGERLRNGETIICKQCNKGHYITDAPDKSKSHFFYCDVCDSFVHIDDNIVVE